MPSTTLFPTRLTVDDEHALLRGASFLALVVLALTAIPVHAESYYWDGTSTTSNADGGNGTWDTNLLNWNSLAKDGANLAWVNSNASSQAFFGDPAGTVMLGTDISASMLTFSHTTGTYLLDLNGNTLALGGGGGITTGAAAVTLTNGTLQLTTAGTWATQPRAPLTLSAKVTGAFDFRMDGNGSGVTLANDANDFTGMLYLQNGAPVFVSSINNSNVASAAGAGNEIQLNQNATLIYNGTGNSSTDRKLTLANQNSLGVNNRLENNGAGTLVFTGPVNNARGFVNGTFTLGGTNTGANEIQGAISDNEGFTLALSKENVGRWIFSGTNTYTGATTINGGTLQVGNGGTTGSLGSGSIVNNANLVYNFANNALASLPAGNGISGSGNLTATAGQIRFNGNIVLGGSQSYVSGNAWPNSMRMTANTILVGSAISMTGLIGQDRSNPYTLALNTSAANGPITLNLGIGQWGRYYGIQSFTANAGTGLLTLKGSTVMWDTPATSFTGGLSIAPSFNPNGPLTLHATAASSVLGDIGLKPSSAQNFTVDSGVTLSISGALSGTGAAITKLGTGTLTLSGNNTYSGDTITTAGTLIGVVGGTCSNSAVSITPMSEQTATLGISVNDYRDNTKQWSCASLTFNNTGNGTKLDFIFGSYVVPSTTVAPLKVNGAVAFSSTPSVTVNLGYNVGPATTRYPLMTWGSQSGTVPMDVTVTAPAPGAVTGHFEVSGNTLYLVIDSVTNMTPQDPPSLGLSIAFDSEGVPVSVANDTGFQLLSGISDGFYLLEANNEKRRFNQVTDLGGGAYRFAISGSPEQFTVQFSGSNDYLTCRFTSMAHFALQGERLLFRLSTVNSRLKVLALDHMVSGANGPSYVQAERINLWEQAPANGLGGFAVYQCISPTQEDETLFDLWTKEGLPHPKVAGVWDKATAKTWLTNWIAMVYDVSALNSLPNTLAEHYAFLPYAAKMDAKGIYLFNTVWRGEYQLYWRQNDEINPAMYPNGLADMVAFKNALATNGMKLHFHYLSGNIGAMDPQFVYPNVSPDLQNWGTVTLTAAINSTASTMIVQPDAGVKLPDIGGNRFFSVNTFRIGNEWITAGSITNLGNGTWQLSGVSRGENGTTAQSYSAGTSLRGYWRAYWNFMPDPDSALHATIATRFATLNNTLNLQNAVFDGGEIMCATGGWGFNKFTKTVYENLDHPTIASSSGGAPPPCWLEYKFNQVKDAFGGSPQTEWGCALYLGDLSRTTPGLEEIEHSLSTFCQANKRAFGLGTYSCQGLSLSTLTNHGLTDALLTLIKDWKHASFAMSAAQRTAMFSNVYSWRPGAQQAIAGPGALLNYLWRLEGASLRKWYALGTGIYGNQWIPGQNESGNIPPRFYLTNGQTQTLIVPTNLNSGAQQTRIIGRVLPRFDSTNPDNINLMTYLGTTNLTLTRTNTTGATVWDETQLTTYGIRPSLDLSTHRGLGLWVTGDNSGATLVIRLQSGYARDYVVPLNFTGRRWIEIPLGEAAWRVSNWGWVFSARQWMNYRSVNSIKIGIGHIPANTTCSVLVEGLTAMREIPEGLVNPTITLGEQSVSVTGTIATENHFILDPSGLFTVYDPNWNVVSTQQLKGLLPASLTTFSMQSTSSSSNTWLEVGVQASNETVTNPGYAGE